MEHNLSSDVIIYWLFNNNWITIWQHSRLVI